MRFRFGLEGWLLRFCRDFGRPSGSRKLAPMGVGDAAETVAIVSGGQEFAEHNAERMTPARFEELSKHSLDEMALNWLRDR